MTKEQFEKIELEYGCGYWYVCDDHSCPCHPTAKVSQGFDDDVYESMKRQQEKDRDFIEQETREIEEYLARCKEEGY